MIRVSYRLYRGRHSVRARGNHPDTGQAVDTTAEIPTIAFEAAGVSMAPRGKRELQAFEQFVAAYAQQQQQAINMPPPEPVAVAPRADEEMNFAQVWDLYRQRMRSQLNPATIRRSSAYAAAIAAFFDAHSDRRKQRKPSAVRLGALEEFRDARLAEGISPRTVWNELGFARQLCRWALAHEDETRVTSIGIDKLPTVKGKRGVRPKIALRVEQFAKLIAATYQMVRRGTTLRKILVAGVTLRLRKTPLLALRGEWFARREAWLNVPAAYNKGKMDRYEPISIPAPAWVLAMIADLPEFGLLWPSAFGRQHTPNDAAALRFAARNASTTPERDEAMTILSVAHRAKAESIAALEWNDVALTTGEVRGVAVRQARASRTIILAESELMIFRELRDRYPASVYVFPSLRGSGPVSARMVFLVLGRAMSAVEERQGATEVPTTTLDRSLAKACEVAGVPRITLHDLRRTGNSWLIAHRCERHSEPVQDIVRERLLAHQPEEMKAAYDFIDDATLREAVERYDCIRREVEEFVGKSIGVVEIARRKTA